MAEEEIRLNKYLSEAGICSRREADRCIEAGKVLVNGKVAGMGQKVKMSDCVEYCGREVIGKPKDVLLLFNKPVGIVCTAEKREKHNVVDYIDYSTRLYPVGRLDKNSRGLLLMTNQGDLVNQIMRSRYHHEKEYIVRVDRPIDAAFVERMAAGVYLSELKVTTRPCKVEKLSKFTFRIILTQGTQPPDPPHVYGMRLSCTGSGTCAHHEPDAGRYRGRAVSPDHCGRIC